MLGIEVAQLGSTDPSAGTTALVVHLLPLDLARGAQRYAKQLRERLDRPGQRHVAWTLFGQDARVLSADVTLGVTPGRLRTLGVDPRASVRLRARLREARPALIVAHGSEPLKYLRLGAPRALPIVYYKIGVATKKVHAGPRLRFHRWLVARAACVAGVSEDARAEAVELLHVDPRLAQVIPNGRDPEVYRPGGDHEGDGLRLLFVGHFAAAKRPERFVEIVRRLRGEGLTISASAAGDGPLLEGLRDKAREAGLDLLGRREDIAELMRGADVLVFTSIREGEGMPGTLIEASLSGLPIVTTAVPGSSDVVLDGETGLVVGIDDLDGLVAAVRRLALDDSLRVRMGTAAREHAVASLGLDASIERWRALIDDVVAVKS